MPRRARCATSGVAGGLVTFRLPNRCLVVARQPTEANQLKTIWRQKPVRTTWPCDPPPSNVRRPRSATTGSRQRPRLVPASLTRPHHDQRAIGPPLHPGTLPNGTGMLLTRLATRPRRATAASADERHRPGRKRTRQLPTLPRASQHQLEHIHMLLECGRLCNDVAARTAARLAAPSRRWCNRAAPTRHQRATGVSPSPHTRQRSERTNDIANAPFWRIFSVR